MKRKRRDCARSACFILPARKEMGRMGDARELRPQTADGCNTCGSHTSPARVHMDTTATTYLQLLRSTSPTAQLHLNLMTGFTSNITTLHITSSSDPPSSESSNSSGFGLSTSGLEAHYRLTTCTSIFTMNNTFTPPLTLLTSRSRHYTAKYR